MLQLRSIYLIQSLFPSYKKNLCLGGDKALSSFSRCSLMIYSNHDQISRLIQSRFNALAKFIQAMLHIQKHNTILSKTSHISLFPPKIPVQGEQSPLNLHFLCERNLTEQLCLQSNLSIPWDNSSLLAHTNRGTTPSRHKLSVLSFYFPFISPLCFLQNSAPLTCGAF